MSLAGRIALVTGGSSSIGRGIALALAREGAFVAVHYNNSAAKADKVVEAVRAGGGTAFAVRADISSREEVRRMVRACEQELGPVDVLVNNARQLVKGRGFFELTWEDDFAPQIDVMFRGTFHCCQETLPGMKERGWGRVITLLSTAVSEKRPNTIAYGSAKAAMLHFSQVLAAEVASYGITVNMVSPGLTQTDRPILHSSNYQDEYLKKTPMGRLVHPEDIAEAVVFFAKGEASYITGVNMAVAGGRVIF